jgi:hypothetical protein
MATEAQIQANRLNAQKSTGPRTAEGKAQASQNAGSRAVCTGPSGSCGACATRVARRIGRPRTPWHDGTKKTGRPEKRGPLPSARLRMLLAGRTMGG